ncbi:MAG: chorismate-binding protein [Actinomyces sp.]|uniref:isochorismate synthase n=1 Tax=Actinomyces sp. TaxID=29317 RepID=UPI0026DBD72E|nr:chorismate-binding protein [Actinomyces sp.]MDO4242166.1 chorismate-binding protein [Actinomyces sp.]
MTRCLRLAARDLLARPPRLTFSTTALAGPPWTGSGPPLSLLAERNDVVAWVREGHGLAGWDPLLRIEATGPGRIEELRAAWRAVVQASWWSDPLVRPGTGPVALGAITFAPSSREPSVLLVPRVLVGRDAQGSWVTTVGARGEDPDAGLDAAALTAAATGGGVPTAPGAALAPGARSEASWRAAVATASARLRAGQAEKVVLARDVVAVPRQARTTGGLLARLAAAYPSCWTFAVDGMVGASPELLVRLRDRRLSSRVLAGTARRRRACGRDEDPSHLTAWLEKDPKNNREHALARASALTALEPLCSVVEAPERFVLTLPNVLHLASDISGVVAGDTGALALVGALHPTAAVCGTPTPAASRLIVELEGMDRGRYAGPVGWVDWHGEGEWCIALRSAQLADGGATGAGPQAPVRVLGGGGIMPGSDPADELAETAAKMRPVLDALGAP